jgi:hypothetical protein
MHILNTGVKSIDSLAQRRESCIGVVKGDKKNSLRLWELSRNTPKIMDLWYSYNRRWKQSDDAQVKQLVEMAHRALQDPVLSRFAWRLSRLVLVYLEQRR